MNNSTQSIPSCGCRDTGSITCGESIACDPLQTMPLAMAYIPWQQWQNVYEGSKGLESGSIFQELIFPFERASRACSRGNSCSSTCSRNNSYSYSNAVYNTNSHNCKNTNYSNCNGVSHDYSNNQQAEYTCQRSLRNHHSGNHCGNGRASSCERRCE